VSIGRAKKTGTRRGGRRRNYAPAPDQVGWRAKLPTGWANWLGFVLFGIVGICVFVAAALFAADGVWADAVVAAALGAGMLYMVYLFGTTRLRM
jgi:hypothetical protein